MLCHQECWHTLHVTFFPLPIASISTTYAALHCELCAWAGEGLAGEDNVRGSHGLRPCPTMGHGYGYAGGARHGHDRETVTTAMTHDP